MGIVEIFGLAGSISLLSGWRLYLCAFATGLAMRIGWIALPEHLEALAALANPWVLGASFIGLVAEFFADKVAWLDSAWDAVHGVVRPLGGALLTLAIVDAQDPVWQALAFLLGGGGTLLSHSAKASARAVVNASPEPVSNVVVSTGEDVAAASLLALAIANPVIGVLIAFLTLAFVAILLIYARRAMRTLMRLREKVLPVGKG